MFNRERNASPLILAIFVIVAAVGTVLTPAALAAENYVFNPVLSLTGGCAVSEEDSVADPGCPGGAHPPKSFTSPRSVVTDFHGDIYVASYGLESVNGAEGRIDVFGPDGSFITEVADPWGPKTMAVDSKGNLYVFDQRSGGPAKIERYEPSEYKPEEEQIFYGKAPVLLTEKLFGFIVGLSINIANDHLFANLGTQVVEFGSAAENNEIIDGEIGKGELAGQGQSLAVDSKHGLIYVSANGPGPAHPYVIKVFELSPPYARVATIDGSPLPPGEFSAEPSVAVEEESGDLFTYFEASPPVVYRMAAGGEYLETIEHDFQYVFRSEIGVDNGPLSPNKGYLFVPSRPSSVGNSFAFGPSEECPPEIEASSFDNVTQDEAELQATINPCDLTTSYVFEYTSQGDFEAEGFAGAQIAGQGNLPVAKSGIELSAMATGLSPQTAYYFRITANNALGSEEAEGRFTTYPAPEPQGSCSNDALRTVQSRLLPDCRAYELVTPPDTNGRSPQGIDHLGTYFTTREASPMGDKVSFLTEGGTIPGFEGTGALAGDTYLAARTPTGWTTSASGPTGEESSAPVPGSNSPDQGYAFWKAGGEGSAIIEGGETAYLRYPDGHSELIGRGSVATDPYAAGKLISENGAHVIFVSSQHLEEDAPSNGTAAVYDRTIDQATGEEETHVASLLPGNVSPVAGENALYQGASLDGKGVAFSIGKKLYLRFDDEETYEIGEGVTFAGVAEGGARIFYVKGGDLFAFDANAEEAIQFTESGDVTPVNVAAEGTAAYFVSPSVVTGVKENPNGAIAQKGEENLYLSREGAISFVGTVTQRDVNGVFPGVKQLIGLGLWVDVVGPGAAPPGRLGQDPSRATPDGSVILFESRAELAGYDPEGHDEVYRYDSVNNELDCLSCNPTQAPATGEASLQSVAPEQLSPEPFSSYALVNNLRSDGRRAFFQSTEALVQGDTDGLQDVYEWEKEGVGSCKRPEGCVYLISSGHSNRIDYLYGVSDSGGDVFFRSSDLLVGSDADETPSIYDARVEGGFPEPEEEGCEGEGCKAPLVPGPVLPTSATSPLGSSGNIKVRQCPRGKRKVKRHGQVRCVKKRHRHRHHARSQKGAGK